MMIVIVGARGADGVNVSVNDDEQPVPDKRKREASSPANGYGQFRQQSESRHTQQDTGAERKYDARPPLHTGKPES